MKIRNGYVSNSSSSSFIIGCSSIPETKEEASEIWFGGSGDVTPNELESLFLCLEEITVDFEKMLTLPIPNNYGGGDSLKELADKDTIVIYREIFSDFSYGESMDWKGYWSSAEKSEMDVFIDNYAGDHEDWRKKFEGTDAYFKQDKVAKKFRKYLSEQIKELQKENKFMACDYGDEDGQGHMEHEFLWSLFPAFRRFSHH